MIGDSMRLRKIWPVLAILGVIGGITACDPATRYKISSTIFDGVPRMPPAEQYCREYHENASREELEAAQRKALEAGREDASSHPPYAEKKCNNCHDKESASGFVVADARKLCAHCHIDFPKGAYLHGPAAVGSCRECHEPHNSNYPSLLVKSKEEICRKCHVEDRLSKGIHDKALPKGMLCTDCHDPHAGDTKFFLR